MNINGLIDCLRVLLFPAETDLKEILIFSRSIFSFIKYISFIELFTHKEKARILLLLFDIWYDRIIIHLTNICLKVEYDFSHLNILFNI